MQATCPRCGNAHSASMADGPAVPCPSCGYTALVVSAAPPARDDGDPTRWAAALAGCMVVSGLVLVCALMLARFAEADEPVAAQPQPFAAEANCQTTLPACVDPSLWAQQNAQP